jgi:hypothetical protein
MKSSLIKVKVLVLFTFFKVRFVNIDVTLLLFSMIMSPFSILLFNYIFLLSSNTVLGFPLILYLKYVFVSMLLFNNKFK